MTLIHKWLLSKIWSKTTFKALVFWALGSLIILLFFQSMTERGTVEWQNPLLWIITISLGGLYGLILFGFSMVFWLMIKMVVHELIKDYLTFKKKQ